VRVDFESSPPKAAETLNDGLPAVVLARSRPISDALPGTYAPRSPQVFDG
jgi:hypothetical protein